MPRNPDFVIIGAMKAGTTSLFRWLGRLDDVGLPPMKEVHFFFYEDRWAKGLEWYRSLFPEDALVTGEASPGYTDPDRAESVAERIRATLPDVRLIFVARHPVDRLRSHYRHEVQKGREDRRFVEAASIGSAYVTRSMYWKSVAPYVERFPADRLLFVRFEDLVADGGGWQAVLDYLGLPAHPRPTDNVNPTEAKRRNSPMFNWLRTTGAIRLAKRMPRGVRRLGARTLTSDSSEYRDLLQSSQEVLPGEVEAVLWEDAARLETQWGTTLWPR